MPRSTPWPTNSSGACASTRKKCTDHHAQEAQKSARPVARRGLPAVRRAAVKPLQDGVVRLIFLSGLSGSGKSVALHMLEDLDFYCIDNIPAALLKPFISHTVRSASTVYQRTAIGIDARNPEAEIATVPTLLDELKRSGIECELVFLVASDEELLRRFAETRRKHPLSRRARACTRPSRTSAVCSSRWSTRPIWWWIPRAWACTSCAS